MMLQLRAFLSNLIERFQIPMLATTLLFFTLQTVSAQYSYSVNSSFDAGNPGGTTFNETATTGWTDIGLPVSLAANQWSPNFTLPFAFDFFGTPVTALKVSANGLLTFNTAFAGVPTNANGTLPDASLPDNTIAVFWDEFTSTPPTATNDRVYTQVFGTAPNRQLWVYWFSFEYGNPSLSFQYFAAVLEETSNNVYVVDVYGSATPLLTSTVGVQLNATTAVQIGNNLPQDGNGTANTDNDYYEFSPFLLSNDNAGITALNTPVAPFTSGTQLVDVTVKNWGQNALNSATVDWTINGVAQTSVPFTGPLASLSEQNLSLGNGTFPAGNNTIKIWTTLPNGTTDTNPLDDTLSLSLCTGLSGTYTVGGVTPDYATLTDVVNDLSNCGISGPVTFLVAPGTYAESLIIPSVPGSSATNTITFDGGSAATTIITYDGTGTSNSTIRLDGTDYLTFQNLTVEHTGTTAAWGIHLMNEADHNTIENCNIQMNPTATSTTVVGIISTSSLTSTTGAGNNANFTTLSNNTINGGYYGTRFYGSSTANLDNTNNTIDGCSFSELYYGIYGFYQDGIIATDNTINFRSTTTTRYGIYVLNSRHSAIQRNTIIDATTYGIYLTGENAAVATPTQRSIVINNMSIASGAGDALYVTTTTGVDIFNNSFSSENDQALWFSATATDYNIRNNIFASVASQAVDIDGTPGVGDVIDYNVYFRSDGGDLVSVAAATYATLADWQLAVAALNVNSQEGDPIFVNSSSDLHVQGTLANNVGTSIAGITVDIDGEVRSGTTPDIGADEFSPASCLAPSVLDAINISSTGANLTWTAGGSETTWNVEYGLAGFTQGLGTLDLGTSNPHPVAGLLPNTIYEYYVQADCGGSTSFWAGPYSFTTFCAPFIAPWTENFDNGGTIPSCWAQGAANAESWLFSNTGSGNHIGNNGVISSTTTSGNYFAWVDDSSPHNLVTTLESPLIDVSALTNPALEFFVISNNEGFTNVDFSVDVWDGAAWNVGFYSRNSNTLNGEWEEITVNLSPLSITGNIQLRFVVDENNGTDFYDDIAIDDVSIIEFVCSPTVVVDTQTACDSLVWIDGNTYSTNNNTASFTYIGGAADGCDSIVNLDLTIVTSSTGTDTRTECSPYTWIDGISYTANNNTATFNIVGGNSNGCDSLVTLDLTITNASTGTDVQTACDSYSWIDGNTYTANNNTATFTIVGGAASGCDSIVTLDLTINNSTTGTDVQTACDSYTWIDGNTYTSNNNTATFTIVGGTASGCDSVVTLDLTINNSTTGTDVQTACNSYTWIDGNTYSANNNTATFTIVGGAANGCDSIVTLDLTINSVSDITTTVTDPTISANNTSATYQWLDCDNGNAVINGETNQSFTATANGNYAVELSQNGCVDTSACVAITTVGIMENSFGSNFIVYPNPTSGNFSIDLGTMYANPEVRITDVTGKLIDSKNMTQSQILNLTIDEPAGIYYVTIIAGDKIAVIQLIKE